MFSQISMKITQIPKFFLTGRDICEFPSFPRIPGSMETMIEDGQG